MAGSSASSAAVSLFGHGTAGAPSSHGRNRDGHRHGDVAGRSDGMVLNNLNREGGGGAVASLRSALESGLADLTVSLDLWKRDAKDDTDVKQSQLTGILKSLSDRMERLEQKLDTFSSSDGDV